MNPLAGLSPLRSSCISLSSHPLNPGDGSSAAAFLNGRSQNCIEIAKRCSIHVNNPPAVISVTAESRTDPRKKNFAGYLGDVPITRIVAKKQPANTNSVATRSDCASDHFKTGSPALAGSAVRSK
jgi:hypothetical protein